MYIVTFSVRYKPGVEASRIYDLSFNRDIVNALCGLEGFISWNIYAPIVPDRSVMMVLRFETHEAVKAWRNHPRHMPLMELGWDLLEFYDVQILEVARQYIWENGGYSTEEPAQHYGKRSLITADRIPSFEALFGGPGALVV